jgi:hypothetical protein
MKALSIRQPWAWCIVNLPRGYHKDVENRDWKPGNPGLRFRGQFLIHASKTMSRAEYEQCLATCKHIGASRPFPQGTTLPAPDELLRGGIIGRARLVSIVDSHPSPWFFGPLGLVLDEIEPLPFLPMKGALGFFEAGMVGVGP